MPEINQLSSQGSLASGDQFPIFSTTNGVTRKVSASAVADFVQSQATESGTFQTQYASPNATGFSITIAPATEGGNVWLLLTPLAGYAAGTIILPADETCIDGQEIMLNTTQAVTTLTTNGNGAAVNGAPTTLATNAFFRLKFDQVNNSWYRVG